MQKIAMLSIALLFTAFASKADIRIETCIQDHVPNTNCFQVQVTIINDTKEGPIMISQGSAWIGTDCKKNGHMEVPNKNPECPPVVLNEDVAIYTTSAHCMEISNDKLAAAVLASISEVVNASANKVSGIAKPVFQVFPNPATNYITVSANFEDQSHAMLYITDVAGKVVYSVQVQNPQAARFTLPLTHIAPGNYTVSIKNAKATLGSQKITVR